MDGFAVAEAGKHGPQAFEVIGEAFAGHPFPRTLKTGQSVRITTGAPLPPGAVAVVPLEEARDEAGWVILNVPFKPGRHVCRRGEEFHSGEVLVGPGEVLEPEEMALLASTGVDLVKVVPRPRAAVLSTGDELVDLGRKPGPGQIINSNLPMLKTRLRECGCDIECLGVCPDDRTGLGRYLEESSAADLVISTGGVPVGEKDQVREVLAHLEFHEVFWKMSIIPGKPVLFGCLKDRPFFGLPGNPDAAAGHDEKFFPRRALQAPP